MIFVLFPNPCEAITRKIASPVMVVALLSYLPLAVRVASLD